MADPLIWTERASADIEAIVRYIARRNPQAATSIGLGIYAERNFFSPIRKPAPFSTSCEMEAGGSLFTADGRLSTRYEVRLSLSVVSGPLHSEMLTLKHLSTNRPTPYQALSLGSLVPMRIFISLCLMALASKAIALDDNRPETWVSPNRKYAVREAFYGEGKRVIGIFVWLRAREFPEPDAFPSQAA